MQIARDRSWHDISSYVVHFVKQPDAYSTIMSILSEGRLVRGEQPFGAARHVRAIRESQRAVCLSEIPLGHLARLVDRRKSCHGIGFTKRLAIDQGAAPLWYLEEGSHAQQAFASLVNRAAKNLDPADPLWQLTPLVDYPSGPASPYRYDFRWEREWRLASDLHFEPEEVAFLLIEEGLHDAARSFFAEAAAENLGPAYFCPYIDPRWSLEQVRRALGEGR